MTDVLSRILVYGDQIELKLRIKNPHGFIDWSEEKFDYVKYNFRKDVARWGLSITSLDGELSGVPDLDSLKEYNLENGTHIKETDCNQTTIVYEHPDIKSLIGPFADHMTRSHILKLGPSGFFPPHRDSWWTTSTTFRLIVPMKNTNPRNGCHFMLEDKVLHWNEGSVYFLNTSKVHTLFNASFEDSYWIVFNILNNEETFELLMQNLAIV